tara:strand:- start:1986 stop:2348 length:363 start_codon:yes stop_codon:yes gene_type:complete
LLSGLFVLASLSLAMQLPAAENAGARQNNDRLFLATSAGSGPYILGKTSQTIKLVRKKIAKDSGPDKAPDTPVSGNFPIFADRSGLAARTAVYGHLTDHILFRSGSRSISPRAPPTHISG